VGHGAFWSLVNSIDLKNLGFVIIGVFVFSWIGSTLFYKLRGYDRIGDDDAGTGAQAA
jgi:high-affinity nickel-transport protein